MDLALKVLTTLWSPSDTVLMLILELNTLLSETHGVQTGAKVATSRSQLTQRLAVFASCIITQATPSQKYD